MSNKFIVSIVVFLVLSLLVFAFIKYSWSKYDTTENWSLDSTRELDWKYVRPDVVKIDNALYFAMASLWSKDKDKKFRLFRITKNLDILDMWDLLGPDEEMVTDIRLSTDGSSLWYWLESVEYSMDLECGKNYLNSGKYSILGDNKWVELNDSSFKIAFGCPTGISFIESINKGKISLSDSPKAVDDPTPFYNDGYYYLMARGWKWTIEYLYKMDEDLNVIEEFELDLGEYLKEDESISQNSFVDINWKIYLIAGVQNWWPVNNWISEIKAFLLSDDFKKVDGVSVLIESDWKYFTRVTSAKFDGKKLYFNYLDKSKTRGDDKWYIAVFGVGWNNSFEFEESILFQDKNAMDNHSSFELLDGKIYVFYQTSEQEVMVKVFK